MWLQTVIRFHSDAAACTPPRSSVSRTCEKDRNVRVEQGLKRLTLFSMCVSHLKAATLITRKRDAVVTTNGIDVRLCGV